MSAIADYQAALLEEAAARKGYDVVTARHKSEDDEASLRLGRAIRQLERAREAFENQLRVDIAKPFVEAKHPACLSDCNAPGCSGGCRT